MPTIFTSRDGAIARVVFSNPLRRNAMTLSMWRMLADKLRILDNDPEIRVILLTGDGDKAFVSGADISEFEKERANADAICEYDSAVLDAQILLANSSKITVASVQGVCFGGGLGLLLACDLRYACETARFRMPAGRLGLGYRRQGMQQMVGAIGASRAAELFYTARIFDGREAQRINVLHQAFPDPIFSDSVLAISRSVAENAPLTLQAAKLAIKDIQACPEDQDLEKVNQAVQRCFESDDYREGRRAFMERRTPRFTGR